MYGISLTAIKFFSDTKIAALTSGRPSQNFDIVGMAFPRRFDVKLDTQYVRDQGLRSQGYRWIAYEDNGFTKPLGKEFNFQNNVDPMGWISYVTKGIFPNETTYFKLELFEQRTGLVLHQWFFEFRKDYQRTLDNRMYVIDPVSDARVVKDGHLLEVQRQINRKTKATRTVLHQSVLHRLRPNLLEDSGDRSAGVEVGNIATYTEAYETPLFEQIVVHYVEEPVSVFFITPPHLMSYAKIILILINQMFNMQVDKSYLTLASQKPFYTTNYMLDEVGNLQSDGNGIPFLQTKESIGLAQGQYFSATRWGVKSAPA